MFNLLTGNALECTRQCGILGTFLHILYTEGTFGCIKYEDVSSKHDENGDMRPDCVQAAKEQKCS